MLSVKVVDVGEHEAELSSDCVESGIGQDGQDLDNLRLRPKRKQLLMLLLDLALQTRPPYI